LALRVGYRRRDDGFLVARIMVVNCGRTAHKVVKLDRVLAYKTLDVGGEQREHWRIAQGYSAPGLRGLDPALPVTVEPGGWCQLIGIDAYATLADQNLKTSAWRFRVTTDDNVRHNAPLVEDGVLPGAADAPLAAPWPFASNDDWRIADANDVRIAAGQGLT
jgi:hypothetical protein